MGKHKDSGTTSTSTPEQPESQSTRKLECIGNKKIRKSQKPRKERTPNRTQKKYMKQMKSNDAKVGILALRKS